MIFDYIVTMTELHMDMETPVVFEMKYSIENIFNGTFEKYEISFEAGRTIRKGIDSFVYEFIR